MANLLDEASILLTPTAYNNGSILAIQPSDGSGDMTFSRGSSATRVNEQGLIEDVQILSSNLVSNGDFSQEGSQLITNGNFATDTDWILGTGWSIGDGKAISDGTQTSQSNLYQSGVVPINKTYKVTFSTVVTSGSLVLAIGGSNPQSTVTTSGTYTYTSKTTIGDSNLYFSASSDFIGSITNISVKEVGQDWTLGTGTTIGDGIANITQSGSVLSQSGGIMVSGKSFKITFTISNYVSGSIAISNLTPTIYRSGNGTYTLNAVGAGGDFKFFSSSFTGSVTNISVIEITDDTNLPRIDYTDGCGSLLLEPQSTNLITQSELFSDAYWTKQSGVTPTYNTTETLSPDGTYNATKLVGNGTTGIFKTSISVSGVVSRSFYLKSVTGTTTALFKEPNTNIPSPIALTITNEWQRFEMIGDNGSSFQGLQIDDITSDGLYIWGAMLEQNSFSTSYIPTQGAISTRLQDIATNSGNASLINSESGVLYAEIAALADDLTNRQISINNGTTDDRIQLYYSSSSNQISIFYKAQSGATAFILSYVLNDIKTFNKVGFKWLENDFALWVNGIKVDTNTSGVTSNANSLTKIDFKQFNNSAPFYGKTKALAVYKTALTDAQLTLLTTL